jgi:hypothetical protein
MTDDPRYFQINLNPDGVAAPAHMAAQICREIVDLYFDALSKADLSEPPPSYQTNFFRYRVSGPNGSAEERRTVHQQWILAKAFQDLIRGVRASLDEAYLFIELLAAGEMRVRSSSTMDDILSPLRETAQAMNFPTLMDYVNQRLTEPIIFSDAYLSMQKVRNCLEHRGGVVGRKDTGDKEVLELSFPGVKAVIEEDGKEIEVYEGYQTERDTAIKMKLDVAIREFKYGETMRIEAKDFDQITFACALFAGELAKRLPQP